jgi:MFS family permease
MTTSKNYYAGNSTTKVGAFFLGTRPELYTPTVDHSLGGWGEQYTFSVIFTDADYNVNNLSLWKSYDNSTWYMVDSKSISGITVNTSNNPSTMFKYRFTLSFIHKLLWLPIILIPIYFLNEGVFLFIFLSTLSSVVLSFANTAWSAWVGGIVPEKIRGKYFGKRNTIESIFSFSTTLLAGWLLGLTNNILGFSFVFFLAFIFGLISYSYLTKIPEARDKKEERTRKLNVLEFVNDLKKYSNFNPFTAHMSLISFAVNLASPFFTVYMLSVMNVGYYWYGIVVAIEILTKIFMLRYWGRLADKFGDRTIMSLCNTLIVFYPLLFLFVGNVFHLILISIFSGIAWSGFDLTTFNYLLDVTPPEKRSYYIANYKMAVGVGLFLGPLVGGFLSIYFAGMTLFWLGGLQILFLLSFILRAAVTAYGLPSLKEVRVKSTLPVTDVFLKTFAVYPARGITHDLVYVEHRFESLEKSIEKKFRGKLMK